MPECVKKRVKPTSRSASTNTSSSSNMLVMYYYRELQSLRDPLHFPPGSNRGDPTEVSRVLDQGNAYERSFASVQNRLCRRSLTAQMRDRDFHVRLACRRSKCTSPNPLFFSIGQRYRGGYEYPDVVRFEIEEQDLSSYLRAADFLNISNVDIVCLQHEFGIFGGPAGGHILAFLRELRMPVVTTVHTVLREPRADQSRVMRELISLSTRVVVMSERGRRMLQEIYEAPPAKVDLIPHGIPDMGFVDPTYFKDQFGVEGKVVLLTFGLLSPNKGIECVLNALPKYSG